MICSAVKFLDRNFLFSEKVQCFLRYILFQAMSKNNLKISYQDILGKVLRKFPGIGSPLHFSGNSKEFPQIWSPFFRFFSVFSKKIFPGIGYEKFLGICYEKFVGNDCTKISSPGQTPVTVPRCSSQEFLNGESFPGNSCENLQFLSMFTPNFSAKDSWDFPRIPGINNKTLY